VTETRALGIVAAVGVLLIGLVLLIGVGPLAAIAFLYVAVLCLILDRTSLFNEVEEARADADEAVRKTDAHGELIRALTHDLDALRDWCGLAWERIEGDDQPWQTEHQQRHTPTVVDIEDPTTQPIPVAPDTQPAAALITPQAITGDDDTWLVEFRAHLDNLANGTQEEAK
jgi:hypothetical protein